METQETQEPQEIESKQEGITLQERQEGQAQQETSVPTQKPAYDPVDSARRAVNRKHAELMSEREVRQRLEQEIQQLRKGVGGQPKPENFEEDSDYIEKLIDYKVNQRVSETESDKQKSEIEKALNDHMVKGRSKYSDFEEVLESVSDVPVENQVGLALLKSQRSHELHYYLAKNKEEYLGILSLPVSQQLVELGKIEQRLATEESSNQITRAPGPTDEIPGGGGGIQEQKLSRMTFKEKEDYWNKQDLINRGY